MVEPNDKIKSTFPLVTFAFILTLATGFVKKRKKLIQVTFNSKICLNKSTKNCVF